MQKVFDELTIAFRKHDGVLNEEQYKHIVSEMKHKIINRFLKTKNPAEIKAVYPGAICTEKLWKF